MRIAIITTHPPSKGSLNEYAYHFVRYLRHKTDTVSEIALLVDELPDGLSYPPVQESDPIPVHFMPVWKFGAWNNLLRIRHAIRKLDPDIVFFNIQFASFADKKIPATLGLLTPWVIKRAGYKTVILLHNIMETVNLKSAGFGGSVLLEEIIRLFGNIVTRFLLAVDLVAVTIPKYVEILESKYDAQNVLLTPHGSFEEPTDETKMSIPDGPVNIMTFGKFGTYKKVEILLEAFEKILPDHPEAELVVAGTDNPSAAGYLEKVKTTYAHIPNVHFTGYVKEEDVAQIFNKSWVVIFPYTSTTGSSGVLHQAGSYGKPVVLPNLGDLAELVSEEGYDGEYFEPTNASSLADAIRRVIDNPDRLIEISTRNYLAAHGLPINDVVEWYLIHFEELLKN